MGGCKRGLWKVGEVWVRLGWCGGKEGGGLGWVSRCW